MKAICCRLIVAVGSAAILVLLLVSNLMAAPSIERLVRLTRGTRQSLQPSLSNEGNRVAFESDSDLLGQGIVDDQFEVWLYDRKALTVTRVTTASGSGSRYSHNSSLSGDGTKIAFQSDSNFPGYTVPEGQDEIWLYNIANLTYTRVTTGSPVNRQSQNPSLNDAGTVLAFASTSALQGVTIPVGQFEIWLYDIQSATYTRITTGTTAGLGPSNNPSLSGDGTRIAFESRTNLLGVPDAPVTRPEIWLYDTQTLTFTRITTASGTDRESRNPAISRDGTKIVFESDSNLASQVITNDYHEIWLYDIVAVTYTRVTTATGYGYRESREPSLDGTGSKVAFSSSSDLLHEDLDPGAYEIWLYDVPTRQLTRLTQASDTSRDSGTPSIAASGRLVAFRSDSDFLSQGIISGQDEIWLYDGRERTYLPLVLK